jgi:molecular chaperone GrpE
MPADAVVDSVVNNSGTEAAGSAPPAVDLSAALQLADTARIAAEDGQRQARDAQMRALAELDNVRKRALRDVENAQRYALERFASELLAVRDSLELAVSSSAGSDVTALVAGQQATLQLLQKSFEKFAIQQINPAGAKFDPVLHEAVMAQPTASTAPDTVLQVLQAGYQLNGRLLRPARVIVAASPPATS